ncbi:hypothetical protein D9O40_06140 [Clostridium autoethanogenum]|uniref:Uncharacterized protein n=1 Tax=Clostridium autoethanogenum TaxID=84023 RepID=A0A3M0SVB3_9CLOT|nr:hypothetical protein [Clostridium autoethanogenum]RMD02359.1 hypothetical protein D9O40_06140 [Clostridium autoethanogenum]
MALTVIVSSKPFIIRFSVYTDGEVITIIETVMTEYKKRWSKLQYPTPTIPATCGWLSTQAITIVKGIHKA